MDVKSNKQYNPQMHSAEHILNQAMVRMFNCGRSFSNHIEKKKSKFDNHFDLNLTVQKIDIIDVGWRKRDFALSVLLILLVGVIWIYFS